MRSNSLSQNLWLNMPLSVKSALDLPTSAMKEDIRNITWSIVVQTTLRSSVFPELQVSWKFRDGMIQSTSSNSNRCAHGHTAQIYVVNSCPVHTLARLLCYLCLPSMLYIVLKYMSCYLCEISVYYVTDRDSPNIPRELREPSYLCYASILHDKCGSTLCTGQWERRRWT